MHDAVSGERLGVPSVGVMTDKFVSAAELMARTLGADGYAFTTIAHPISSAGGAQLDDAASSVAAACERLLTTP